MLEIDLMTITRTVVHTIPARGQDKEYVPPSGGESVLQLSSEVNDAVVTRITKALGKNARGVQTDIVDVGTDSIFQCACLMMDCDENQFVTQAQIAAEKLARVQHSKAFKPAKLICIRGTITKNFRPFIAFVKAELQQALSESQIQGQPTLEVLKNLFLTESNKLYKIGFISRNVPGDGKKNGVYQADQHSSYVYDHLMNELETRSAAFYFYNEFLGTDATATDRRLTRNFFEKTLEFIKSQNYPSSKRIALGEALRTELRSNDGQLSVNDFSASHIREVKERQAYITFMTKSGFPSHAITKDIEFVRTRLKKRQKVIFTTDVVITTPPGAANDLLKFKDLKNGTTIVTIKGEVESNE